MAAGTYNITIEQGATFKRVFTWKDSTGVVKNITGYKIWMMGRTNVESSAKLFSWSTDTGEMTLSSPTGGEFTLEVTAAATAALDFVSGYYDIEMIDVSGKVTRLLQGTVTLSKEITR